MRDISTFGTRGVLYGISHRMDTEISAAHPESWSQYIFKSSLARTAALERELGLVARVFCLHNMGRKG